MSDRAKKTEVQKKNSKNVSNIVNLSSVQAARTKASSALYEYPGGTDKQEFMY